MRGDFFDRGNARERFFERVACCISTRANCPRNRAPSELGVSFFVMVVMGHHTPYSWAAWVTKWSGVFLAATVAVGLIALLWLVWLLWRGRGREEQKYAGLRILR